VQFLPRVLDANFPTMLPIFDNLMTERNQDRDIKRIWSATCSFLIDCNFIFLSQASTFVSILPPITQSLDAILLSLTSAFLTPYTTESFEKRIFSTLINKFTATYEKQERSLPPQLQPDTNLNNQPNDSNRYFGISHSFLKLNTLGHYPFPTLL
jgi:hypothetical protein